MTQVGLIVLSIGIDDDPETGSRELVESLKSIDPPSVPRLVGSGTAGGVRLVVEPEASTVLRWLDSNDEGQIGYGQHGRVLRDLTLERNRQIGRKGYTLAHDDAHDLPSLVGYALDQLGVTNVGEPSVYLDPIPGREQLVKAAAVLVATIESIDRRAARTT